jgi:hypothetical protein
MIKYILFCISSLYLLANKVQEPSLKLPDDVVAEYQKLPKDIDYNQHVKPILSDKCFACHGPDKAKQKAGLRLDIAENAYAPLPENKEKVAIMPKNLEKSEVFHRIISTDPKYMMPIPKSHLILSAKEKAVIVKWIEDGAVYKPHWAFVNPNSDIKNTEGGYQTNTIDKFILKRLEEEGLQSSKEADKEILLRRVSLDLTGLPPTLDEIAAFLNDKSPNAYEKQVDRLLASPHYGEKMATDWLDLARFADTHGYTVDRLRDMSPYRDWVIKAYNQNMPFDAFIQQQLAGDLMPNPTKDMLIATAFNRNHPQNTEGGIVEEEFQTEYVMDRTNTFGDAFMAISVGCARCHDHKYDPISQKNYYELYSFFNNVREAGQISWNDDLPTPTLMLPTEEKEKILKFLNEKITEQAEKVGETKQTAQKGFENWVDIEGYKKVSDTHNLPPLNLQGFYNFEDSLKNALDTAKSGVMKREHGVVGDKPVFAPHDKGKSLVFDGDIYADLKNVGVFRKSDPFSVGIWAFFPENLTEGVIFHKSNAERLYNFKGFHLHLKKNKLEILMAHTAPSNALTRLSTQDVPKEKWVQLTMTYDGSSKADGFKLYLDGEEMAMETVIDQLYKDIIFFQKDEPALQLGGWWRGLGFRGGKIDDVVVYNRTLTPFEIKVLAKKADWASVFTKNKSQLTGQDNMILKEFYVSAIDTNVLNAQKTLQKLRAELADSTEYIPELMIMQEMPKPKKTHILGRGQYDMLGEEVHANTPQQILPFLEKYPKNRLGLAQWLTDDSHPLTARVAVNRLWQNFFGVGLVKTSEDFGNQGEMPSHHELLDWLAVRFREIGWDIKKMNKLIAMSATYRQSSKITPELRERDPDNRLLARGAATRLSAEMVRDNALAASGLLNKKIGGKSIKPYQPEGLWEINSMKYVQDSTEDLYRRSLYIVVKRSVQNPTLGTFDAPSRSSCIARRQKTTTPLQALVTLNDPTFVEVSKVLGEKMAQETNISKAITDTYRKLTGRTPSVLEVNLLVDLQKIEYEKFKNNTDKMKGWVNMGLYKIDGRFDMALVAANAVVANTILNSDAVITKR